jgi:hypothetical protein
VHGLCAPDAPPRALQIKLAQRKTIRQFTACTMLVHRSMHWENGSSQGPKEVQKKIVKTYEDGILFGSKDILFFHVRTNLQKRKEDQQHPMLSSCGVQRRGVEVVG